MMILVETLMVLALLAVLQIALASVQQIEQQQKPPPKTFEATEKLSLIDIYARIDWESFIVTLVEFLWLALRVAALMPALLTLELSALATAAHRLIGSGLQRFGLMSNTWLLAAYKQVAGNNQGAVKKKSKTRRSAALS